MFTSQEYVASKWVEIEKLKFGIFWAEFAQIDAAIAQKMSRNSWVPNFKSIRALLNGERRRKIFRCYNDQQWSLGAFLEHFASVREEDKKLSF